MTGTEAAPTPGRDPPGGNGVMAKWPERGGEGGWWFCPALGWRLLHPRGSSVG